MVVAFVSVVGGGTSVSATETPQSGPQHWVDEPVTFEADGVKVYGTFRRPTGVRRPVPAVLLIAGSGPTDRNGNSPLISGKVDTLLTLAQWLSDDGVASLRYDKLGSGRTGLGPYATDPDAIGIRPFEQEAVAGLTFLSRQPGISRSRLGVMGHSEGALFALLVATGAAGPTPPIHALGLLEPLSRRYLDVVSEQLRAQVSAAESAGTITPQSGAALEESVTTIIADLRGKGTLPGTVPSSLTSLFNPSTTKFLSQADRYDPARLGSELPKGFPVLVSCSDADVQVSCDDVGHLVAGLSQAEVHLDVVHLVGVDHVLKEDPSLAATNYGSPLPFSSQLREALQAFVERSLT
jgi:acetyl esterase/lipase